MSGLVALLNTATLAFYLLSIALLSVVYLKSRSFFVKGLLLIIAFLILLEVGEVLNANETVIALLKLTSSGAIALFITLQSFKEGVL